MAPSTRKRQRTIGAYDVDPYRGLESDPEAAIQIASSSDEEFNPMSPGRLEAEEGSQDSSASEQEAEEGSENSEDNEEDEYQPEGEAQDPKAESCAESDLDPDLEAGESVFKKKRTQKERSKPHPSTRITHRVGMQAKSTSKRERIELVYGNEPSALHNAIIARDLFIADPALPQRKSLRYSPFYQSEIIESIGLDDCWQKSKWLQYTGEMGEYIERYLPDRESQVKCILGPLNAQKMITFARFGICDLNTVHKGRNSYILHTGGHVAGLDWAPNHPEGAQYLAVSPKNVELPIEGNSDVPPAFARTSGPSNIQIWRVPSTPKGALGGKPSLAMVICHDWGTARSMKWCPIPRARGSKVELGCLAAVFSDGVLRVMKVTFPEEDSDKETYFAKIEEPLFEGRLEDTLCTCMTWLSTHEIAVGCGNGFIAAWDIRHAIALGKDSDIIPHHYFPAHQTYISDITSCFPSFPNTVLTTSMDGHARMTSLYDPHADNVSTGRSRLPSYTAVWVDYLQAGVASEEGTWIKVFGLRRFFSSTSVAKQSAGGIVMSMASSMNHPMLLAGGQEGEVIISNPLRRLFHAKITVFQQTWFQLEFSEKSDMYRILEGFKMDNVSFKFEGQGQSEKSLCTVFEERGAVTKVCWNSNTAFGGWAAAGTAVGFVRIEDLAV